jgi:cytochrome P450
MTPDEVTAAVQVSRQPQCPFVNGVGFDPLQPDQVLDPHPWMEAARRETPVFYMPEYDEWCVTRHEDVLAVLRDTTTFSSKNVVMPRTLPGLEGLPDGHPMAQGLVNTDPPDHTRLRKLAQKAFTPKMVASYEPEARATAHRILDEVLADGHVDLLSGFARAFTCETITRVIGAPPEHADQFKEWSDDNILCLVDSPPLPPDLERKVAAGVVKFDAYLRELIEARRQEPREDFASLLVTAESDDGTPSLTTFEIVRVLTNTVSAGFDTSASMICLMIYHLCEDRSRWERVLADRDLVGPAIEETLRYDSPIHGIRRDVMKDTEIGGVHIPRGSKIYTSYASAQRDERVFAAADRFDLDRDDVSEHFAFGKWTHFCLGAPLARMEAKVALEVLLERIPSLRLAPGARAEAMPSRMGAFLTGLQVEWTVS